MAIETSRLFEITYGDGVPHPQEIVEIVKAVESLEAWAFRAFMTGMGRKTTGEPRLVLLILSHINLEAICEETWGDILSLAQSDEARRALLSNRSIDTQKWGG